MVLLRTPNTSKVAKKRNTIHPAQWACQNANDVSYCTGSKLAADPRPPTRINRDPATIPIERIERRITPPNFS
jgi:hypothetical protein